MYIGYTWAIHGLDYVYTSTMLVYTGSYVRYDGRGKRGGAWLHRLFGGGVMAGKGGFGWVDGLW